MVHVRLSGDLVRIIDHMAVDANKYRNEMMEQLLRQAIDSTPNLYAKGQPPKLFYQDTANREIGPLGKPEKEAT